MASEQNGLKNGLDEAGNKVRVIVFLLATLPEGV